MYFVGMPSLQSSVLLATSKRKLEKDISRQSRKIQRTEPREILHLEPLNPDHMEAVSIKQDVQAALFEENKASKEYDDYLERAINAVGAMDNGDNSGDWDNFETSLSDSYTLPFSAFASPLIASSKKRRYQHDSSEMERSPQRQRFSGTLSEEIGLLNQTLELQKSADHLFEIRLQCILNDTEG